MRRAAKIGFFLFVLTGCGDGLPAVPMDVTTAQTLRPSQFNPASTGTIAGQVRWSGPSPVVPTISVERFGQDGTTVEHVTRPNPHAPAIDASGNYAGAVIFLRGVDPEKARPWDLPAVTLELNEEKPMVRQGDAAAALVGFVHRGDTITMVSKQAIFHSLRARGTAFFTLTFPDPEKPRKRVLNEVGRVELSSAAGYPAMRGHLFVDDHPYYAMTDSDGRFRLSQVPAGKYELVCWRPDWRIERQERDPESLLRVRLHFHPPKETAVPVTVHAGETATVMLEVGP